MILDKLIASGFDKKEAQVYVAILELGEATIAEITKKSNIKRSTVYEMLELLKQRGVISQSRRKKRPIYLAESPKKLLEQLEEKKRGLEDVMPELLSITNLMDKKPKIRYFEGLSGVKEVFEDTLRYPDSEVLTFFPYPYINLGEEYFREHYFPERSKQKIWVRAIVPDNLENQAFAKSMSEQAPTVTRFVKNEVFNAFDIEIKIYGKNKVGIISYKEDLGLIMESQKIFEGLKAIFEVIWKGAED
jgi:sugar-specific transcriptional regulator TrmB